MRITKYNVELDENLHNILIKESASNYPIENFTSPETVVEMLCDVFRMDKKAEEYVYLLALNTKGKLLGLFEVSHGTVNASLAEPREIFIRVLLSGAKSIILTHNHPSGDTTPSRDDLSVTKRIEECGKIMGLPLLDHIIIGKENFYSMKQYGVIN